MPFWKPGEDQTEEDTFFGLPNDKCPGKEATGGQTRRVQGASFEVGKAGVYNWSLSVVECQGSLDHMTRLPILLYIAYNEGRAPQAFQKKQETKTIITS